MKKLILISTIGSLAFGCAMKQKVMDVPVVSMTHTSLPPGSKLRDAGPVSGKFCPDSMNDKGSIGLFDEAIKNAQTESHADFISNVSFFLEGTCVSLEGTAQTIVADTPPPADATQPSAKKTKK